MTILLVEDNPFDLELAIIELSRAVDNEIVPVITGMGALKYLETCKRLPTLVLLDLGLPDIDGTVVLYRIRHDDRMKHLSVVVLTSSREDFNSIFELRGNAYIVKPITPFKLESILESQGLGRRYTIVRKKEQASV